MDTLKKQRPELSQKKKALYTEYRKAQADIRQAVAVKANIDHLLDHADEQKIRPRSISSGPPTTGTCAGTSLDKVSRSSAGLGSSSTSIFTGLRSVKISEYNRTQIAFQNVHPHNMA